MSWTWRLEGAGGSAPRRTDAPRFDSQSDAESWLGETWQELLEQGIASVSLYDGDRAEYEHMSLSPPEG